MDKLPTMEELGLNELDSKDRAMYLMMESSSSRVERINVRLWITILVLIVSLIGTNAWWIWYESKFEDVVVTQEATADGSSAAGYCQITRGTAKWIYEDKLHYGEYDEENHIELMTTNWKLNIELSCRLMYCWYWNFNESWTNALEAYHGGTGAQNSAYIGRFNNRMTELFGMTLSDFN